MKKSTGRYIRNPVFLNQDEGLTRSTSCQAYDVPLISEWQKDQGNVKKKLIII
jgi:hypothetical protein